jgi:protein subunit release factor B
MYYCFSLDKLYPPSDKREMKDLTAEEFSGHIPISEITRTFSCSGGPGGQNVNKVATKVDVRSDLFQYIRF